MIKTTFHEFAEVASKQYDKNAREELEKQLNYFVKDYSIELIKKLGLPQVLMFFSSSVAKSNKNKVIQKTDVEEAFSFLRYLVTRDFIENVFENKTINLGLPIAEQKSTRLKSLLQVKGGMKTKNNLDLKISRLISFLEDQKLLTKHINRIEIEIRATILLLSRLYALGRSKINTKVSNSDIDLSYDLVRYMVLKLDTTKLKILKELYTIDETRIWSKMPKMVFDQTAHDHLSSTAYASWESELPESFETLKKYINCGSRPFISAIFGFSEIYGARKGINRVNTDDLMYILEDFEKAVFGKLNPMIIEENGIKISFSEDGLKLLKYISDWITNLLIDIFGKDEFVFNFTSTVPRQISLLLFISIVESIKRKTEKIDDQHLLNALIRWSALLKPLMLIEE